MSMEVGLSQTEDAILGFITRHPEFNKRVTSDKRGILVEEVFSSEGSQNRIRDIKPYIDARNAVETGDIAVGTAAKLKVVGITTRIINASGHLFLIQDLPMPKRLGLPPAMAAFYPESPDELVVIEAKNEKSLRRALSEIYPDLKFPERL